MQGWGAEGVQIKYGTHSLQAEDGVFLACELEVEENSAPTLLGKEDGSKTPKAMRPPEG